MNEDLLKEIAIDSGGAYIPARTQAYDLGQIYEDHLAGLTRGELVTEKRQQYRERYLRLQPDPPAQPSPGPQAPSPVHRPEEHRP